MKTARLSLPSLPQVEAYCRSQKFLFFTYRPEEASRQPEAVPGYDNDSLRQAIGHGRADFARACAAIRGWRMFPIGWTRILPMAAPIEVGTTVMMCARFAGLWWPNACRIVYVIDEPDRFGFAYGTLPGHVESGEELFLVELDAEGTIWYTIRAFSRPRHPLVRLGYPLVRRLQARFRRDSAASMLSFVSSNAGS